MTHVGAGPGSGATGIHRPWTPLEAAVLRRTLGRYYDLFLSRVSLRRKIERDTLLRSAGGRLFFGDEALERRLVDHQGGVVEAIADVRQRAGIAPGAPHELLLLPRLSLGVRLQLALGGGPGALLSALLGGLGDAAGDRADPDRHARALTAAAVREARGNRQRWPHLPTPRWRRASG